MFNSIFVKIFIWITILGAFLFFFVFKEVKSIEEKQLNYRKEKLAFDRAQIDIDGSGEDIQSINEYVKTYEAIPDAEKMRVNSALPTHDNEIDTRNFLFVLAVASGLRSPDVQVPIAGNADQNQLQTIQFTVTAYGSYSDLLVFLKQLEHSLRIFHITQIQTQRQTSSTEELINENELVIQVMGETYYYPSPK